MLRSLAIIAATLCGAAVGFLAPIFLVIWGMTGSPDAGLALVVMFPVAGLFSIVGMAGGRLLGLRFLAALGHQVPDR